MGSRYNQLVIWRAGWSGAFDKARVVSWLVVLSSKRGSVVSQLVVGSMLISVQPAQL